MGREDLILVAGFTARTLGITKVVKRSDLANIERQISKAIAIRPRLIIK